MVKDKWISIKRRLRYIKEFYGWYFPTIEKILVKRKQIDDLRALYFRSNEKDKVLFCDGELALIDSLLLEWHNYKYDKGSSDTNKATDN